MLLRTLLIAVAAVGVGELLGIPMIEIATEQIGLLLEWLIAEAKTELWPF